MNALRDMKPLTFYKKNPFFRMLFFLFLLHPVIFLFAHSRSFGIQVKFGISRFEEKCLHFSDTSILKGVKIHLTKLKQTTSGDSLRVINTLLDNIIDDKVYIEDYRDGETFVVLPLRATDSLSRHIDTGGILPLQFLLLTRNIQGEFRRWSLILFYPDDKKLKELPLNSFRDFYKNEAVGTDGSFVLVMMSDIKAYEMVMRNSQSVRFRLWQTLPSLDYFGNICIRWVVTTTLYKPDGNFEIITECLKTNCIGSECSTSK